MAEKRKIKYAEGVTPAPNSETDPEFLKDLESPVNRSVKPGTIPPWVMSEAKQIKARYPNPQAQAGQMALLSGRCGLKMQMIQAAVEVAELKALDRPTDMQSEELAKLLEEWGWQ